MFAHLNVAYKPNKSFHSNADSLSTLRQERCQLKELYKTFLVPETEAAAAFGLFCFPVTVLLLGRQVFGEFFGLVF